MKSFSQLVRGGEEHLLRRATKHQSKRVFGVHVRPTHIVRSETQRNTHAQILPHGTTGASKTQQITRPSSLSDRKIIFLGTICLTSAYVFYKTNQESVFFTGRVRTMALSWEREREIAESLKPQYERDDESLFGIMLSPKEDFRAKEVQDIAQRIIKAAEEDFYQIRGKLDWTIVTRENVEANAFCRAGGFLTVFTGLVDLFAQAELSGLITDARTSIACVIAHEIAHGYCRHAVEHMSWLPLEYPVLFLLKDSTILQAIFAFVLTLPYSRKLEFEADDVGLELLSHAGYDPQQAILTWEIIDKTPGLFEWLSTHPVGKSRYEHSARKVGREIAIYELNKDRFSESGRWNFFRFLQELMGQKVYLNGQESLGQIWKREMTKKLSSVKKERK